MLYFNLFFVHALLKAFNDLTEEQKSELSEINLSLFDEQSQSVTDKNYYAIKWQWINKLLKCTLDDLFKEEIEFDIGKINMLFLSRLADRLEKIGITRKIINSIAGVLIDFLSDFNK